MFADVYAVREGDGGALCRERNQIQIVLCGTLGPAQQLQAPSDLRDREPWPSP